jgi:uncharacterized protein (DUF1015 family)
VPVLKPFKAYKATPNFISEVTVSSADFNSDQELMEELRQNPSCYLHMSKNHLLNSQIVPSSAEFFQNAKVFFDYMVDSEVIKNFKDDIFYVYRQTVHGISHTGIIGLCDMVDYGNDRIKKHEHTRPSTEKFLADYIEATQVVGEPILLSHHHKQSLEDLLRWIIQGEPDTEFRKNDRRHQIWVIDDPEMIHVIQDEMRSLDEFYIMDGHHRIASISNLYEEHKTDAYRYCISFVLDCNQLTINPFHRLVKEDSISFDEVITQLEQWFELEEIPDYAIRPEHKGEFVFKSAEGSYLLRYKGDSTDLDVRLLEETVLKSVFHIEDSRLDERITFLASEDELSEGVMKSNTPGHFLFLLHPCTFEEIAQISDNHQVMPPKSTYVEPKSESGLFIQPYANRFE